LLIDDTTPYFYEVQMKNKYTFEIVTPFEKGLNFIFYCFL